MPKRAPRWRRISIAEAAVIAVFVLFLGVLVAYVVRRSDAPSVTIYSSQAYRVPGGARDKQSADMERAARLALREAGDKAGGFTIAYVPLDTSNRAGESNAETIGDNARRAADDSETAVYIGDFTSGASVVSIPILSKARVPQISPTSSRVGLTVTDPAGDANEPDVYYPNGYRNFVRVIPNDHVQAAALVALMQRDGCQRVALIHDGSDYGEGLVNDETLLDRPLRVFRQSVRPNAAPPTYERLARTARKRGADCFQYAGASNPNTLAIFQAFARALPEARLYATDGVRESTFIGAGADAGEFGKPAACVRVSLMVPPRDLTTYPDYLRRYRAAYPDVQDPDPAAIYAYEAMKLALSAIDAAASGERAKILDRLRATRDRSSQLGSYSIDGKGDTTLLDYDVSRIRDCRAASPKRAVSSAQLGRAVGKLRRRAQFP